MDDVPNAQAREDDDIDEEWPVVDPTVQLTLPPEIALSLSGSNPQWTSTSGKRSGDILTASSVKASRINEQDDTVSCQPTDDSVSNQETGLDEFGLPAGGWQDFLMDVGLQGLQDAANFPLAGWASYKELYGCDPPTPILSKDSAVALLMHDDPQTEFIGVMMKILYPLHHVNHRRAKFRPMNGLRWMPTANWHPRWEVDLTRATVYHCMNDAII